MIYLMLREIVRRRTLGVPNLFGLIVCVLYGFFSVAAGAYGLLDTPPLFAILGAIVLSISAPMLAAEIVALKRHHLHLQTHYREEVER